MYLAPLYKSSACNTIVARVKRDQRAVLWKSICVKLYHANEALMYAAQYKNFFAHIS